jgi:hypothetical protein
MMSATKCGFLMKNFPLALAGEFLNKSCSVTMFSSSIPQTLQEGVAFMKGQRSGLADA